MLKRKKEKFNLRKQKGWLAGSSATQTICVSFLLVIAAGTLLLSLPIASKQGRLGLVDALFTATSATCVTGLVVRDTWTQFTFFGQAVLLLLIQVGGLGLVTLTSFFALAARRRMGFRDLRLLGESVSAEGLSKATEVLKIVIRLAATFEAMGAVLLMFALVPQFGPEGIWVSIFTAISAFCNAGFDLFGRFGAYSSVVPYVNNYYVQDHGGRPGFHGLGGAGRVPQAPPPLAAGPGGAGIFPHSLGAGSSAHRPDGMEQPRHHGRAERPGQDHGGAVPIRFHPNRRHEYD